MYIVSLCSYFFIKVDSSYESSFTISWIDYASIYLPPLRAPLSDTWCVLFNFLPFHHISKGHFEIWEYSKERKRWLKVRTFAFKHLSSIVLSQLRTTAVLPWKRANFQENNTVKCTSLQNCHGKWIRPLLYWPMQPRLLLASRSYSKVDFSSIKKKIDFFFYDHSYQKVEQNK